MNNNSLVFNSPAACWEETILLGNGSLGFSCWGGQGREVINLNHDSFWAGTEGTGSKAVPVEVLERARSMIKKERYGEAESLLIQHYAGPYTSPYQPLGDILFDYIVPADLKKSTFFSRSLDLESALYHQEYGNKDLLFSTEGFVSYPASMGVLRFKTSREGGYTGILRYASPYLNHGQGCDLQEFSDSIIYSIRAPYKFDGFFEKAAPLFSDRVGIKGYIGLKIIEDDGKCVPEEGVFHLSECSGFTLYVCSSTDWNGQTSEDVMKILTGSAGKTYPSFKNEHIIDYKNLYNEVDLSLNAPSSADQDDFFSHSIPDRIRSQGVNPEKGLVELLFNYGRYLLIASSRPGSQPANLQGIWNPHIDPPWWSNYTMNINTEMNYWGAGLSGLTECALPLFDFSMRLRESGKKTAEDCYSCRGWCAHHQSDLWAGTFPRGRTQTSISRDSAEYSLWPFSGVWLSLMAWEHYEYTGNNDFLYERVKPLLEGSIYFIRDFLQDDGSGGLTTIPSTSPENRFHIGEDTPAVSCGTTMDLSLVWEALLAYLKMSELISCNREVLVWSKKAIGKINPFRIGRLKQLQEWSGDWDREDDKHRHLSHLYCIYPGKELMNVGREAFREAAAKSLDMRGMDATGWSIVWKIVIAARLNRPDKILILLRKLLTLVDNKDRDVHFSGGGCYPNLMCAHPPFQIDGNLGIVAAISEIFLRQTDKTLTLLPSLPGEWPDGHYRNIHCKGGINVSLKWGQAKLTHVRIEARERGNIHLVYGNINRMISFGPGDILHLDEELRGVEL